MRLKHLFFITGCTLAAAVSCKTADLNAVRSESIEVYQTLTAEAEKEEPVNEVSIGVLEGDYQIFVKTNTDITPTWQDDQTSPWAKVVSYEPCPTNPAYHIVTLHAKRLATTCYYTRRTGMLLLGDPSRNLGFYLKVHQGCIARISGNFSFLKYGTADPRLSTGDKIYAQWSAADMSYKYTSTPFAGVDESEKVAFLYGKNGYVRLGDDKGHGADIITPYADAMRADSLLMVSFKAVAFTELDGTKDANKISVEVLGGGVIKDQEASEGTRIEFEAPYYDLNDDEFPSSMWDGSDFLVFVKGTQLNPITANTQIRITAGSLTKVTSPNRVFVDNIYVRTLNEKLDPDFYTLNGGSGPDKILGQKVESDE